MIYNLRGFNKSIQKAEKKLLLNCYFHCGYSALVIADLDVLACTGIEKFWILEADPQRCQHGGVKKLHKTSCVLKGTMYYMEVLRSMEEIYNRFHHELVNRK